MKKYILFLCALGLLSSCFKDDSTVAKEENRAAEIVVEGLKDTSVVSFSTTLELTPTVPGYTDDELSFAWYIYGGEFENQTENGYRTVSIGNEKTLVYPVELKTGTYTVVCEATHKETGYFGLTEFTMNVTTAFSEGFYILKETPDGNTDIDIYNYIQKSLKEDLLATEHGAPMSGEPRNMTTVYGKTFMDPTTAKSTYGTGLFVASGANEFTLYNTDDLSKMFDRSDLLFGEMEADEIPYGMATFSYDNFYFSSKGIRSEMVGSSGFGSEFATGKLGMPSGAGASTWIQACDGNGLSYWSENEHRLMYASSADCREIPYREGYTGIQVNWSQAEVVASGWNHVGGINTIWFLFDVSGEGRYLVLLDGPVINDVQQIDPSLHLATADVVAGNGLTGQFIYSIENNRLYRYSIPEKVESESPLEGLPAGEVTYLVDLFYSSGSLFDYIIVGVQNGAQYSVLMYEIEGSRPKATPAHTFSGTGTLKKVCYVRPTTAYSTPNYYAFTEYAALYGMGPDFPY